MIFLAILGSSRLSEELFNFWIIKQFLRFLNRSAFRFLAPKIHHISQTDHFPFPISFRPQTMALLGKAGTPLIEHGGTGGVGQGQPRMLR